MTKASAAYAQFREWLQAIKANRDFPDTEALDLLKQAADDLTDEMIRIEMGPETEAPKSVGRLNGEEDKNIED
jgi:hypothetical protein